MDDGATSCVVFAVAVPDARRLPREARNFLDAHATAGEGGARVVQLTPAVLPEFLVHAAAFVAAAAADAPLAPSTPRRAADVMTVKRFDALSPCLPPLPLRHIATPDAPPRYDVVWLTEAVRSRQLLWRQLGDSGAFHTRDMTDADCGIVPWLTRAIVTRLGLVDTLLPPLPPRTAAAAAAFIDTDRIVFVRLVHDGALHKGTLYISTTWSDGSHTWLPLSQFFDAEADGTPFCRSEALVAWLEEHGVVRYGADVAVDAPRKWWLVRGARSALVVPRVVGCAPPPSHDAKLPRVSAPCAVLARTLERHVYDNIDTLAARTTMAAACKGVVEAGLDAATHADVYVLAPLLTAALREHAGVPCMLAALSNVVCMLWHGAPFRAVLWTHGVFHLLRYIAVDMDEPRRELRLAHGGVRLALLDALNTIAAAPPLTMDAATWRADRAADLAAIDDNIDLDDVVARVKEANTAAAAAVAHCAELDTSTSESVVSSAGTVSGHKRTRRAR